MTVEELNSVKRCPACGSSAHGGMWFEVRFARAFNGLINGMAWLATLGARKH